MRSYTISFLFFFNDTATTEIYTLSLHDALPIYCPADQILPHARRADLGLRDPDRVPPHDVVDPEVRRRRSEEHTSELQSPCNLVCRLLLEKKKKNQRRIHTTARQVTIAPKS